MVSVRGGAASYCVLLELEFRLCRELVACRVLSRLSSVVALEIFALLCECDVQVSTESVYDEAGLSLTQSSFVRSITRRIVTSFTCYSQLRQLHQA